MTVSTRQNKARTMRAVRADAATQVVAFLFFFILCCLFLFWPVDSHTPTPLYFLSVGDFGTGSDEQKQVASQMAVHAAQKRSKFVLSLGDNVYPAGVTGLQDPLFNEVFEDIYTQDSLQVPWYMTLGDHDHRGSVAAQVEHSRQSAKWNMSAPFYVLSFPLGGSTRLDIVVTDSVRLEGAVARSEAEDRRFFENYNMTHVGSKAGNEHLQWLEEVLQNSSADWLMVVGHRPVLSCAQRPRFPAEERFANMLRPLLAKHHVDVYMNGHDHVGQHLEQDGVVYLGNGVGGYGTHPAQPSNRTVWVNDSYNGFVLHRVTPFEMEFAFIASDGTVLHKVQLAKKQAQRDMRLRKRLR